MSAVPPPPPRAADISTRVAVRLLEKRDSVHELTELLHRAYKRHADRGLRAIAAFQDDAVTLKRILGGECHVAALIDGPRTVVGTIVFRDADHTAGTAWLDSPGVASFSQLAVEPYLQGRGIGGLLIRTAEERARACGARHIALSTPGPAADLRAMYEKRGYAFVEHTRWPGTNYESAILSKRLPERAAGMSEPRV